MGHAQDNRSWFRQNSAGCHPDLSSGESSYSRFAHGNWDSCADRVPKSGKNPLHHVARDIGESEIAASVAIGQSLVIHPEEVQNRRVKIVDMHFLLGDG